jgi:hypothetical protein
VREEEEKKIESFSRIVFKLKGQNKTRVEKKLLGFFLNHLYLSLTLVQLNRKKTTHCSTDKRDNYEVK